MNAMNTRDQLDDDLKEAMRSGDELRKRTLRLVLSSIKLVEIDQGKRLDEGETFAVIQKEIKSYQESIADAKRADRPDLADEAGAEIEVLQVYLPQPLSQNEIETLAREAIKNVGATSPKEMGKVMKVLMPQVQGRADGSLVSKTVRQLLEEE
jgi:uncharacterized protein YqeY